MRAPKRSLKQMAKEIQETGEDIKDYAQRNNLIPSQVTRIKVYLGLPVLNMERRTTVDVSRELDESICRQIAEIAKKPPKPVKRVCIRGKWYIDITADFIDCGG